DLVIRASTFPLTLFLCAPARRLPPSVVQLAEAAEPTIFRIPRNLAGFIARFSRRFSIERWEALGLTFDCRQRRCASTISSWTPTDDNGHIQICTHFLHFPHFPPGNAREIAQAVSGQWLASCQSPKFPSQKTR